MFFLIYVGFSHFDHDVSEFLYLSQSEALNLVTWGVIVIQAMTLSLWRRGHSWLNNSPMEMVAWNSREKKEENTAQMVWDKTKKICLLEASFFSTYSLSGFYPYLFWKVSVAIMALQAPTSLGYRLVKSWNDRRSRSPRRYGYAVEVWRWQPGDLIFGCKTTPLAPIPGGICERSWQTVIKGNGEEYWQTVSMGCEDFQMIVVILWSHACIETPQGSCWHIHELWPCCQPRSDCQDATIAATATFKCH